MTSADDYQIRIGPPSVEDYRRLRTGSGLSDKSPEAATLGLAGTWYGVTVVHRGRPVGMGRIIGDGGCHFQIVDVCVLPEHQRHGLGRAIMAALTAELDRRAPATAHPGPPPPPTPPAPPPPPPTSPSSPTATPTTSTASTASPTPPPTPSACTAPKPANGPTTVGLGRPRPTTAS